MTDSRDSIRERIQINAGVASTFFYTFLIIGAWFTIQVGVGVYLTVSAWRMVPAEPLMDLAMQVFSSGFYLSLAVIASGSVGCLMTVAAATFMSALPPSEFLGFRGVRLPQVAFWTGIVAAVIIGNMALAHLLERPDSEFMVAIFDSAVFSPLLYAAVIIIGPLFEELLFRGLLLEGLRHSRLRSFGAVVYSALLWTVIHVQYEPFELSAIFILGVVLGLAKLRTRSLALTIGLHAAYNLVATIEFQLYTYVL